MWATLSGVVLGFALSQLADFFLARRRDEEIKQSVRHLLNLEKDRNTLILERYWRAVSRQEENWFSPDGEFRWVALAVASADVMLPAFSFECWSSNLNQLPKVYSTGELNAQWDSYEGFRLITTLWEQLVQFEAARTNAADKVTMQQAAQGDRAAGIMGSIVGGLSFRKDAEVVAKQFKEAIESKIDSNSLDFK